MKYGYKGVDNKDLIGKYEIESNNIIIKFLDGSEYSVPLSAENEKKVINRMLEQAMDRRNTVVISDIKEARNSALCVGTFLGMISLSGMYFSVSDYFYDIGFLTNAALVVISGCAFLERSFDAHIKNNKIEELKKYNLYLSMKDKLDITTDSNLFNGIDDTKRILNINTLDDYSLNELKIIKENLKRCEEFSEYFQKTSNNPTFTKKISN